jgi:hypothetical protein
MSILTNQEAADVLRLPSTDDPLVALTLPSIDDTIKSATGHDWAADAAIDPTAKLAASLLLSSLYYGLPVPEFYTQQIGQLHGKVVNGEVTA